MKGEKIIMFTRKLKNGKYVMVSLVAGLVLAFTVLLGVRLAETAVPLTPSDLVEQARSAEPAVPPTPSTPSLLVSVARSMEVNEVLPIFDTPSPLITESELAEAISKLKESIQLIYGAAALSAEMLIDATPSVDNRFPNELTIERALHDIIMNKKGVIGVIKDGIAEIRKHGRIVSNIFQSMEANIMRISNAEDRVIQAMQGLGI